jgi:hypothetical protein
VKTSDAKAADSSKSRTPLEKIKPPPGGVVVLVEDVKEALSLLPKMVLMSPEEYQKLLDRLASLEKQLKADKKLAHASKLAGRLDGDSIVLRAEFTFTTEQPWMTVILGLQGAQLTDEGKLDEGVPVLDFGDDGFAVKVEKEGTHHLVLNLKAPVTPRRPATGGGGERGFDLGLPGTAVTTLALDLPVGVKEVRCNDVLEKPRQGQHWEIALGKVKGLSLVWRDQAVAGGNTPLLSADSQIVVKLEDDFVQFSADMTLEDLRGQTKEWRLLLPQNAKVEVKTPSGMASELLYPDGQRPYHVVRLPEQTAERLLVSASVRYPRPLAGPRLAVGPFFVIGAYRQEGTIAVQAPPEALHGERFVFHRSGDIFPRDLPKGPASADLVALFKFWSVPGAKPAPGAAAANVLLELELKADKSQVEASVDHLLVFKPAERGWLIELTSTVQTKSKPDFLDLQLPRFRLPRSGLWATLPAAPFPAGIPWTPLALMSGRRAPQAVPWGFACDEAGLKLTAADANGHARLTWGRSVGNNIKITGRYLIPLGADSVRVELPRPIEVLDRGGKVRIKAPEQLQLFVRAGDAEVPAAEGHEVESSSDSFPRDLELAWRPHRPDFTVAAVTDVQLHDRSAEVKHQLQFSVPRGAVRAGVAQPTPLRLRVPAAVRELNVEAGAKLVLHDPDKEIAWILPQGEPLTSAVVVLRYDFSLSKKENGAKKGSAMLVDVPLIWPEAATRQHAKVRIFSEAGSRPLLVDRTSGRSIWDDKGVEVVPGYDVLPALVLEGSGLDLTPTLRLAQKADSPLAGLVCERGLIQATIDEDGAQTYVARYFVSKLSARHLDIELPLPAADCLMSVTIDKQKINNWEALEPVPTIAQVPVQPRLYRQAVLLEIQYKLPPSFADAKRPWQMTLHPPQFRGDVFLGPVRWQVSVPYAWVAFPTGNMDYRLGLQGWLFGPNPSVTGAELESWLTKREAMDPATPFSLAFSRGGQDSVPLWHMPRQLWLLLCSGLLLAIGVGLYVLPLSRTAFWLLTLGLGLVLLAAGLLWPALVPVLIMGCEPGALVLLVLIGTQWMLQESYRRRLVFMPGFTRLKTNSSLSRATSGERREPSTIDAPAKTGSSVPSTPQSANQGT